MPDQVGRNKRSGGGPESTSGPAVRVPRTRGVYRAVNMKGTGLQPRPGVAVNDSTHRGLRKPELPHQLDLANAGRCECANLNHLLGPQLLSRISSFLRDETLRFRVLTPRQFPTSSEYGSPY
jgi:hypothetical protein